MKLALIRRRFAATGGAELYLDRLLRALAGRGHELHLFSEAWTQPPASVVLHKIPANGSRATRPVHFADAVERQLSAQEFDCVFSLERTRRQDVYRAGDGVHRVWLERRRQFAPWWKRHFIGRGAFHRNMLQLESETLDPTRTRRIIVNSEMVKREIVQNFKFPVERIHLVRNGVDVARFQSGKRAETRARFGIAADEFLLLFVGSGWERKGLKYVLETVQPLAELQSSNDPFVASISEEAESRGVRVEVPRRKIRLLVAGKGRAPRANTGNVIFAGPMSNIQDAYAAADLFVFLPIYEPSSNVVYEALAAGLPVITSNYNGASEIIEPGVNGTVIDLADADASSNLITAIACWEKRRAGIPPIDTAALSLDRNVSETLAILEKTAKEKLR